MSTRDYTVYEYVILGFLAIAPQSGYDIMGRLEVGVYRQSASTGSIYPVLKRLEAAGLIGSRVEAVHELRPRKVYTLLSEGERVLDAWLRREPEMQDLIEGYDVMLHKFLIAEYRFSRADVLTWLQTYQTLVQAAQRMQNAAAGLGDALLSPHQQLVNRSVLLEIETRGRWLAEAIERLSA